MGYKVMLKIIYWYKKEYFNVANNKSSLLIYIIE